MIKIDRASVSPPPLLMSSLAEQKKNEATSFFRARELSRNQTRFDFSLHFAQPEVRDHLYKLFHKKCAYCETRLEYATDSMPNLDRFRPVQGAINTDGTISVDSYWWLAYEWSNMYPCCVQCNRAKGSRFPVAGRRAKPGDTGATLNREKNLLLDPCHDDPESHLLFDELGRVYGLTVKGQTTVEVFSLNRSELVEHRAKVAKIYRAMSLQHGTKSMEIRLGSEENSFSALGRQILRSITIERQKASEERALKRESLRKLRLAKNKQKEFEAIHQSFDLSNSENDVLRSRSRTRYVEHISLVNIGVHTRTEIRIKSEDSAKAPWTVILGENGVGKSTALKAIAFALAGKDQWRKLGALSESLLPRLGTTQGKVGKITIGLSDGHNISMIIDASAERVSGNAESQKLLLLGFGATRLPPNERHPAPQESDQVKVLNLFDPFSPLADSIDWLLSLAPIPFQRAGTTLKELLGLPRAAKFEKSRQSVQLIEGNRSTDLRTLSDGYQTIIGVGCGIMSVLLRPGLPIEQAEGIVLIDEIGNHLHPTWRMRVVGGLRTAFPRVQFISTTHEPLCLRGLHNDEVAVLKRDGKNRIRLVNDLPPVQGLLVDQILASPHFGLHSTIDPTFSPKLEEYYDLISRRTLTLAEAERLGQIEPEVSKLRLVGDGPREQILLRAIDTYLARAKKTMEPVDPADLPEDLRRQLEELLAETQHGTA